ncbi:hypothetical protein HW115_10010 [Verrucomicrobiaceae bacterium N1E253]|uniref:Lon proteolytic domain-containing protein n=1 Tax=Oceaniferula marina TaxID=2748318 RepID=A0A851GLJ2_9BACT|nr:S16 family serine protease [Oceaniferula marina]NWK55947.1 hypothetical protein [Oceaniferula marina]
MASFTLSRLFPIWGLSLLLTSLSNGQTDPAPSTETNHSHTGLQQTEIKGLLVMKMSNGKYAGAAAQMNATVIEKKADFEIGFNQSVGSMMDSATKEVEKFIRVRYAKRLPTGMRIEFAFSNKYSPKDGPSAAVACALMADSILSGNELDQGFAATGDMTATGDVRAVGGVQSKIKGAIKKQCTIVTIPKGNQAAVADSYIIKGLKPLYAIQIFSVETFDEALELAKSKRKENIQKAIDEFALVQKALNKNEKYIYNSKVQAKLRQVITLAPHHLSAKNLLLHGLKKGPQRLSLVGSINCINAAHENFGSILEDNSFSTSRIDQDVLTELIYEFRRLRTKLDKRTIPCTDAYVDLAEFIKDVRNRKIFNQQLQEKLTSMIETVVSERKKLFNNPQVREEIMEDYQ